MVIARGVPTLPASVFPLSDVPFPVCSSFGIKSASFVTANHTVNSRGKLPENGIVIRKLSSALHRSFLCLLRRNFCAAGGVLLWLVQNKHSTRSANEGSDAMLIFVIMGGQWMDGFFDEPSVRAVNSPPPSCYKDSIEQVAPAMPRARHEPI